jgi:uncharacterized protein YndB with AHSA1/START domain
MSQTPDRILLIYIAAMPEKIWALLTDVPNSPSWFFGQRMEVGDAIGDPFAVVAPDGNPQVKGEILAIDPPRRLMVSWDVLVEGIKPVEIEFLIEDVGNGISKLTVHEYHHATIPEAYIKAGREGWSLILSGIKTILETGKPLPPVKMERPQ